MSSYISADYRWDCRPVQNDPRPAWFRTWPGGAQIALSIVILHEWESFPRPIRPMPLGAANGFDYLALGAREYGVRFGLPRLLRVLGSREMKATVICNGLVAEIFPASVKQAAVAGHEIACHQWDQAIHPPVYGSREEEEELLVRSIDSIEAACGYRPTGYMSQGPRPTPFTLDILAKNSMKWTADYVDSDIPYTITLGDANIVNVGYAMPAHVDLELAHLGTRTALMQLKDEFDAMYAESRSRPMQFRYVVHTHFGGRPSMAAALDSLLQHIASFSGVWTATCGEIAEFWRQGEDSQTPVPGPP